MKKQKEYNIPLNDMWTTGGTWTNELQNSHIPRKKKTAAADSGKVVIPIDIPTPANTDGQPVGTKINSLSLNGSLSTLGLMSTPTLSLYKTRMNTNLSTNAISYAVTSLCGISIPNTVGEFSARLNNHFDGGDQAHSAKEVYHAELNFNAAATSVLAIKNVRVDYTEIDNDEG